MMRLAHMMGEVSGEATNNVWHCPMMFGLTGMGAGWMWLGSLIWLATWILIIAVLVALLRWLWKKGGEGEKK